jgi:hypothetical protein
VRAYVLFKLPSTFVDRGAAVLLLLRQRRGAAGSGLGITAKYLQRTTSGAAGNGLGTTMKYL